MVAARDTVIIPLVYPNDYAANVLDRYVYDLRVPPGLSLETKGAFQPKPLDGEVESFEVWPRLSTPSAFLTLMSVQLLPVDQVISKMREGLFKPNCAMGEYYRTMVECKS
jgi:hypothetical protein